MSRQKSAKMLEKSTKKPLLSVKSLDFVFFFVLVLMLLAAISLITFNPDDLIDDKVSNACGVVGAYFSSGIYYLWGYSGWWIVLVPTVVAIRNFLRLSNTWAIASLIILLIASPVLEFLLIPQSHVGGLIGQFLATQIIWALGVVGAMLMALALIIFAFSLLINIDWLYVAEVIGAIVEHLALWFWRVIQSLKTRFQNKRLFVENKPPTFELDPIRKMPSSPVTDKYTKVKKVAKQIDSFDLSDTSSFPLPPLQLLSIAPDRKTQISSVESERWKETIESKLSEFRAEAKVVSMTVGPVVTRYEIEPAQGVKGSKIVGLNNDLARALSLQSVRVVENIAGRNTMGIELPNACRNSVFLSDILSSDTFRKSPSLLTLALGQDISGQAVVADLAKMPHLLVAGTTGSGKSVGINAMILSLLYKAKPDEVRLILFDPKAVELSMYNNIPHLLTPVITDSNQALHPLSWCVAEMEKRYRLMEKFGVKNIADFNQKWQGAQESGEKMTNPFSLTPDDPEPLDRLPYIVVVIDEFADFMMIVGKKIEELIIRLAQKARAAGIHLILATQRPTVNVITGLIKSNIPTRIAFKVSGGRDSATILDQTGAENLLGSGDMLFLSSGSDILTRVHGAFVTDDEVHRVVNFWRESAPPNYVDELTGQGDDAAVFESSASSANKDELFDTAVAWICRTRKVSTSLIQRNFQIGYNRAARLVEQMEKEGIVSPMEHNGKRKVLARAPDE